MSDVPHEIIDNLIPIIAISGGILIAVVAIVCGTVVKMFQISRHSNLKQIMLESGLPPHEIERVLNCGENLTKYPHSCGKTTGKGI